MSNINARNLNFDNKDDCTELHRLLERLSPRDRVRFMVECCKRATVPNAQYNPGVPPETYRQARLVEQGKASDRKFALECYFDLWTLCMNYKFDMREAATILQDMIKNAGRKFHAGRRPGPRTTIAATS
jgi:hypothetical protein